LVERDRITRLGNGGEMIADRNGRAVGRTGGGLHLPATAQDKNQEERAQKE
jgi:hypothetical protein